MGTAATGSRRPGGRLRTDVLALLVAGTICGIMAAASALATTTGSGPAVEPVHVAGKPPCTGELKIEPVRSGTFAASFGNEAGSITITVRDTGNGPVFDFATDKASHLVKVVVVKGGPNANVYDYGAGVSTDSGLHAPLNKDKWYGLSHLCFATALKSTPPPVDVCPNIDGVQTTVPPGMIKDGNGNCVTPPVDVCPNIAGVQTSVPAGMIKDASGNCVTPPVDVCPNIEGVQTSVPAGMVKDAAGNCVTPPPTDECPNIDGVQTTVPAGMIKDASGNCVTPPPTDVCPNIEGVQTTVPVGMIKDASGNCITPPGAAPPLIDLMVGKVDTPDPVSAGRTLRYTITVTNRSSVRATGVIVEDIMPAGVRITSARPSQGSCSAAAARITCRLGTLGAGASARVTIRGVPSTPGTIINFARVHGNEPDPRPENNTTTERTRVVAPFQPPSAVCDTVTAGTRSIAVGTRTTLRIVVKGRGRAVVNARVRVRGAGIDTTARTNRRGVAVVRVRATKRGIVTISVAGFRNCGRRIGAVDGGQPDLTG